MDKEQGVRDTLLDLSEEFVEEAVAFFFVFDEWVALAVALETDAVTEVIHGFKMENPEVIHQA